MKHSFLIAVVILAFSTAAYGLKCYMCVGDESVCGKDQLEKEKATKLLTCGAGMDKCMRVWAKKDDVTAIVNSCANQAACDLAKKGCDDATDGKCAVGCCDSDECNAATPVSFNLFLMTVCSVFGLILLK